MILTLLFGLIAGIVLIIYRGLYFGPWNAALNTMGACVAAALVCYVLFQILASLGGFFLKLLFVLIVVTAIVFGGRKVWNTYNPNNPINFPSSITEKISDFTSRIW